MEIKELSLGEIRPNSFNPKAPLEDEPFNRSQAERLKRSLSSFGQVLPIIVRRTLDGYEIVDGYHRYLKFKELGTEKVTVLDVGEISDSEAKGLLLSLEDSRIPLDRLKVAKLVRTLVGETAYDSEDLKVLKALAESPLLSETEDEREDRPKRLYVTVPEEHLGRWEELKSLTATDDVSLFKELLSYGEARYLAQPSEIDRPN